MFSNLSNPINFIKSKVGGGNAEQNPQVQGYSQMPPENQNNSQPQPNSAQPAQSGPAGSIGNNIASGATNIAAGASAFFGSITSSASGGVTKLFTSVQEKKNGLVGELSTKFDQLTKFVNVSKGENQGAAVAPEQVPPRPKKKKEKKPKAEGEADSSASEYGDEGDKPNYEETPKNQADSDADLDEFGLQVTAFMNTFTEKLFGPRYFTCSISYFIHNINFYEGCLSGMIKLNNQRFYFLFRI